MPSLTPFQKLASMLEQLEKIVTPGHHRTYYTYQVKQAISQFEELGILKYFCCAPRYRQLIQKAKAAVGEI